MDNSKLWTDEEVKEFISTKLVKVRHGEWLDNYMREYKEAKQREKQWEIVSFIDKGDSYKWVLQDDGNYRGETWNVESYSLNQMLNDDVKSVKDGSVSIHSVKRLSDGEVFSVGDKIDVGTKRSNPIIFEIHSFHVDGDLLLASPDKEMRGYYPSQWFKLPKRIPLFTTEDGVDIFIDEPNRVIWGVKNFEAPVFIRVSESAWASFPGKWFSSKDKADAYLLLNKPCLSVYDVLKITSVGDNSRLKVIYIDDLKGLAKQKIYSK